MDVSRLKKSCIQSATKYGKKNLLTNRSMAESCFDLRNHSKKRNIINAISIKYGIEIISSIETEVMVISTKEKINDSSVVIRTRLKITYTVLVKLTNLRTNKKKSSKQY